MAWGGLGWAGVVDFSKGRCGGMGLGFEGKVAWGGVGNCSKGKWGGMGLGFRGKVGWGGVGWRISFFSLASINRLAVLARTGFLWAGPWVDDVGCCRNCCGFGICLKVHMHLIDVAWQLALAAFVLQRLPRHVCNMLACLGLMHLICWKRGKE